LAVTLTLKRIQKLRREGKSARHLDSGDGAIRGLYLEISGPNAASWLLRYELNGRSRWMGLGSSRDFSLAEARNRAREQRQKLADKIDPLDARRAERAAKAAEQAKSKTFQEAAESYITDHRASWKSVKHAKAWAATLATYAYPVIGKMSVADISQAHVLQVLEQSLAAEGKYPAGKLWHTRCETASRLRGRIEIVLDWAKARGLRGGDNPANWNLVGKVLPPRAKVQKTEHFAALGYAELPAFMAKLRGQEGTAARCLEFLILTAARSAEVLGATWNEIDLDSKTWVIPAERMKAGQEHIVPLSTDAVNLLAGLPRERGNPHCFVGTTRRALGGDTLIRLLRRMGHHVTVHGFRSAFRTWAAEHTGYEHFVLEQALGHVQPDSVVRAYQRGNLLAKRRDLMQAWADYCGGKTATENVIPLPVGAVR
jgi:integrase